MRTVPFYGSIYDYSVEAFIIKLDEIASEDEKDLFVKMSSGGGNVFAGWGFIMALKDWMAEEGNTLKFRGDGVLASMAAMVPLFVPKASAIKQTHFMVHRAAVPRWMEDDEDVMAMLEKVNKDLLEAFKAKVNVQEFLALPQVKEKKIKSLKRFFDSREPRIDVNITAKEAKTIGLIDNVVNLSPNEVEALNTDLVAAEMKPLDLLAEEPEDQPKADELPEEKTDKKMTLEKFKADHPELYNQIFAAGKKEGAEEEKDRVEAWMAFNEIDPEAVAAGIASDKGLTQKAMAHFTAVGIKNGFAEKSEASGKPVATKGGKKPDNLGKYPEAGGEGEVDENLAKFDAELQKKLGLEPKAEEEEPKSE